MYESLSRWFRSFVILVLNAYVIVYLIRFEVYLAEQMRFPWWSDSSEQLTSRC